MLAALTMTAVAQTPGWTPTGHWQCGPVRVTTSTDGQGGMDFYVERAWFDNHYTFQRGRMYYNGIQCEPIGQPLPYDWRPRRQAKADECRWHLQDGEVAETPEQQAAYDKCMGRTK